MFTLLIMSLVIHLEHRRVTQYLYLSVPTVAQWTSHESFDPNLPGTSSLTPMSRNTGTTDRTLSTSFLETCTD